MRFQFFLAFFACTCIALTEQEALNAIGARIRNAGFTDCYMPTLGTSYIDSTYSGCGSNFYLYYNGTKMKTLFAFILRFCGFSRLFQRTADTCNLYSFPAEVTYFKHISQLFSKQKA